MSPSSHLDLVEKTPFLCVSLPPVYLLHKHFKSSLDYNKLLKAGLGVIGYNYYTLHLWNPIPLSDRADQICSDDNIKTLLLKYGIAKKY